MQDVFWNNKTKTAKVYRTGIFDKTHRLLAEKQIELPRKCPEVDTFVKQVCGTAKVLETNEKTGTSVYRYRKVGSDGDHYRNALNYFALAASGSKLARITTSTRRRKTAINKLVYA